MEGSEGRLREGGTYNFVLTMFGGCVIRQSQADVAHISLLFLLPSEFERRKSLTVCQTRQSPSQLLTRALCDLKLSCVDVFCMGKRATRLQ